MLEKSVSESEPKKLCYKIIFPVTFLVVVNSNILIYLVLFCYVLRNIAKKNVILRVMATKHTFTRPTQPKVQSCNF